MKQGKIVFSFDDARSDTYGAIKIAQSFGIKSTLNVTTGFIEGALPDTNGDIPVTSMTKEQVVELANNSFVEIACHSHNHTNEFEDIMKGKNILYDWICPKSNLGFVSPGSSVDFIKNPLSKFKEAGFMYVRIGPIWGKYAMILRIIRKLSRAIGSSILFYFGYKNTLNNAVKYNYLIHGVPVIHDNTLCQLKYIVDKCAQRGLTCVFIFHSILSKNDKMYDDNWTWDKENYIKLCEYINSKLNNAIVTCFTYELLNKEKC